MTKQEFENWVISKGYSKDKFGHYQKTSDNRNFRFPYFDYTTNPPTPFSVETITRFKMQANSVRYEKRITLEATEYSPKQNGWLRLASGYYKNLSITPEGKLAGMKR